MSIIDKILREIFYVELDAIESEIRRRLFNLTEDVKEAVKEGLEETSERISSMIMSKLLFAIGLIFAAFGVASYLDVLIGVVGSGFVVMGVLLSLISYLIKRE